MRTWARGRGIGPGCFKRRWGPTPAEIAYGDFRRGYTIVDRVQMSVLRDPLASSVTDNEFFEVGYVGGKRYVRPTLVRTGLTNGAKPTTMLVISSLPRK